MLERHNVKTKLVQFLCTSRSQSLIPAFTGHLGKTPFELSTSLISRDGDCERTGVLHIMLEAMELVDAVQHI